jgi:hypothetical protein
VKLFLFSFAEGLTWSLCSIILLLTPMRSEVCLAKISLFLSRNESSLVSSFGDKSWEIIIVLSGTLGPSGTLLVSHFGTIAGLLMKPYVLLVVLVSL